MSMDKNESSYFPWHGRFKPENAKYILKTYIQALVEKI